MPTDVVKVKNNCRGLTVREGVTTTSDVTPLLTCGLLHSEMRKANDCIAAAARAKPAKHLFDEFWREGELAMLFGAAGTGKSLLAVQVADALARGTPLHGFTMPRGRRKVLYVDLDLSDAQFRERYGRHRFPQNLYRGRPKRDVDLCGWIKSAVEANGFHVVIVDDLSAVKHTHDGIRETLALMRGLKRLCRELGISVLVLSDAMAPKDGWPSESDLMRSRVLCTVADSVFCIGKMRRGNCGRRIFQTRSRAARLFWTDSNCPNGEIIRLESGLLGFEFDRRFEQKLDEETLRLIRRVYELRNQNETFRSIAATLSISKSCAHSLFQKWSPAIERGMISLEPECTKSESRLVGTVAGGFPDEEDDDWDETEISDTASVWLEEENSGSPPYEGGVRLQPGGGSLSNDSGGENHPVSEALPPLLRKEGSFDDHAPHAEQQQSIYDLEVAYNAYHEPIYVESRNERTRQPLVWYQIDRKGTTRRFQRGISGIQVEHLNGGPFL